MTTTATHHGTSVDSSAIVSIGSGARWKTPCSSRPWNAAGAASETGTVVGAEKGVATRPAPGAKRCGAVTAGAFGANGREDPPPAPPEPPEEPPPLVGAAGTAGEVVGREDLMARVWDVNWFGSTKTLDVHIRSLRKKLGDDPADPTYIETVRGVGFRLIAPEVAAP